MPQTRLGFRTTRSTRSTNPKNVLVETPVEKVKVLQSTDVQSTGAKRKPVSSPECSPSVPQTIPKTGHTRAKREQKRSRTAKSNVKTPSKTLMDFLGTTEKSSDIVPVPEKTEKATVVPVETPPAPVETPPAPVEPQIETKGETSEEKEDIPEPVKETAEKGTQNEPPISAKMIFKKLAVREREEPAAPKKCYQTTGGRMLAAALAKKKESGERAHKNDMIRALAAKHQLSTGQKPPEASIRKQVTKPSPAGPATPPKAPKQSARDRFAHLLKPASPKIKPFTALNIASPTKSPSK
eukprot:sb/3467497/